MTLIDSLPALQQTPVSGSVLARLTNEDVLALVRRYPEMLSGEAIAEARPWSSDPIYLARLLDSLPDSIYKGDVIEKATVTWARQDGGKSAKWVEKLPDGPNRYTPVQKLADTWARYEPEKARIWIESPEDPLERDAAAVKFVNLHAAARPEEALWLANDWIDDASKRDAAMTKALIGWSRKDAASARQAMNAIPLSEETRNEVIDFQTRTTTWAALAE